MQNFDQHTLIKKSDIKNTGDDFDEVYLNKKIAYEGNALRIVFQKDEFNRRKDIECDPPLHFIEKIINSFLRRSRYVLKGPSIKPIKIDRSIWRIEYMNNDGTELEKKEDNARVKGTLRVDFSWIAILPEAWNDVFSLPNDFDLPKWSGLQLDAIAALPDIGTSIVLALTSLEVFIAHILNLLAKENIIPIEIWTWLFSRGVSKEPSLDDQYGDLLQAITGWSLKDDNDLWSAFKNIKDARNSFVHEGVACINKIPIKEEKAKELVFQSVEIVKYIKSKLPTKNQWVEYDHKVEISFSKKIPLS